MQGFTDSVRECLLPTEERYYPQEEPRADIRFPLKLMEEKGGQSPQPTIRRASEFKEIYNTGKSAAGGLFVMYYRRNGLDYNRIGISVSKKVGNSVVRHRVKRLVKECLRLNGKRFDSGLDLIVIARGAAKGKGQEEVNRAILHVAKKLSLLTASEEATETL